MLLKMERAARALAIMATAILAAGIPATAGPSTPEYKVPVEYYKLANGLRVVLSPDHTSPTICVGVYYHIGFRIEPRDRTGFAHLFEHMMFQGSQNLGKMEFVKLVQQNGGILNGSTRFDFTNYFETLPSNKLETALWAEADRMGGLAVNEDNLKNQQGVVGNEVKVNVLNSPYGGFPWLDMPQYANTNWYNAHNFYGDLADIEAATLTDVQSFFKTYYAPNNAALAIVGDFDPAEAKKRGAKSVVRRDVVRIVTPGTLTEDSLLDARSHNYLAALAEAGHAAEKLEERVVFHAVGQATLLFHRHLVRALDGDADDGRRRLLDDGAVVGRLAAGDDRRAERRHDARGGSLSLRLRLCRSRRRIALEPVRGEIERPRRADHGDARCEQRGTQWTHLHGNVSFHTDRETFAFT